MRPVDDLQASIVDIITLLGPLAALIPEKPNARSKRGKARGAFVPWNGQAAGVWMEIHAGSREHELNLAVLIGLPPRRRGDSDQNTIHALEHIPVLAGQAPDLNAWQVSFAVRDSDRWLRHTRETLGLADPIHRLPKAPKHDAPLCPYCTLDTLRWRRIASRWEHVKVWCSNPTCRDGEGRRPVALARRGAYSGEESLIFQDGTALPPGLPRRLEVS